MTAASKSALIEQLKARHSSQQQKLQELASRVEQTRKDNRRLRNTLLFLVAAAIVIPVVIFHDRIFHHSPTTTPLPQPWVRAQQKAATARSSQTGGTGMVAAVDRQAKRQRHRAQQGSIIPRSFHPEAVPDSKANGVCRGGLG
jgi:hypothetical protein